MTEGAAAPSRFDAVLLAVPAATARVAGMSLVERAAFTLARAGAGRLLCLGAVPDNVRRLPDVPIVWAAPDDASAIACWTADATGGVVVLPATAVVEPDVLRALAAAPGGDLLEADADVPLWRCPADTLPRLLRAVPDQPSDARHGDRVATDRSPSVPPLRSGGTRVPGAALWHPPTGALIVPADTPAARAAVTRALFARLGRSGDGWFTRLIDRRISRALTRLLVPTGVSPNAVTLVSIATGISAGLLFAIGEPWAAIVGALLFLASTIIDGCDGELARITFRESRLGARLDVIGDNVVHLFLFGGIAFGLYRHGHDPRLAAVGWLLVLGALLAMAAVYAFFVRGEPTRAQRTLFEAFASREFAYLLVVLTVIGRLEWFLWASAVGTYAFVAALVALRR